MHSPEALILITVLFFYFISKLDHLLLSLSLYDLHEKGGWVFFGTKSDLIYSVYQKSLNERLKPVFEYKTTI